MEFIRPTINHLNTPAGASENAYKHVADNYRDQIILIKEAIDNSKVVRPNVNRSISQVDLLSQASSILNLTKEVIQKSLPKEKIKTDTNNMEKEGGKETEKSQAKKGKEILYLEKNPPVERSRPITHEDARTAISQLSKAMCLLWSTSPAYLTLEQKMFQIFLYRAFLYGKFFKRNFSALRLNANAAFSYLTGQYSINVSNNVVLCSFC